eukprot:TRINITY_DN669_c0_g1_i1.p1 TRINITY_DN669_c0_g1~~TRINITY_DN669_c0_g1_i1.p1  ORF type:complete len:558 (+),score=162.55 TRINITY_DN669_c0_g1_i1:96-1676(+)
MTTQVLPSTSPYFHVSLYVGDLAEDVSEGLLYEIFSTVGTIQMIKVCRDDVTRASLGYAYVTYVDPADAERALTTLNHTMIKSRPCRIMRQQRDPARRRLGKGNIYISNLDTSINNKDLYDAFSQFGNILSCKVVLDRQGESKGYGYVHFDKEEDAQKAIELVNGKDIRGKTVYANYFVPRSERLKARENSWTNVFFRNAPAGITKDDITQLFSQYGTITSIFIKEKQFSSETKSYGFVNFEKHEQAVAACDALNNKEIDGLPLYCSRAQKKSEREPIMKRQKDIKRRETISQYYGRNLYIKHIEEQMTEDMLKEEFSKYGTITSARIMYDENGTCKGFGFVCYETKEQAAAALEEFSGAKNKILPGFQKPLYVALHEPKDVRRVKYANRVRRQPAYPLFPTTYNMPPTGWPSPNQYQGYPPQGGRQQQQAPIPTQAPPRSPVPQATGAELPPIEQILSLSKTERREIIGRCLYYLIENIKPGYASKITGMLLEWDVDQIYGLVSDPDMMKAAVEQAASLIDEQQA